MMVWVESRTKDVNSTGYIDTEGMYGEVSKLWYPTELPNLERRCCIFPGVEVSETLRKFLELGEVAQFSV
jgi:hypothetical protein